mgnify:CR=1 FL=1
MTQIYWVKHLYDDVAGIYWLLSSQARDSMTKAEKISKEHSGLPCRERDRLQLHFSKNCIDCCFAGLVTIGNSYKESRNYASMTIDDDNLYTVSK